MFCCSWLCYLSSEWSFNRQRHNWRGCVPVAGFQSSATSWDSEGQRLGVQSLLRLPRLESQLRHFLAVCPRGNRFQYSMPQCSARLRQGLWSDREGKVSRYMSSKIKRVGYCYHLLGGASWTFRNTALKNNYNLWRSFYSHFCSNDHIKSLPHEENKRQSWVRQVPALKELVTGDSRRNQFGAESGYREWVRLRDMECKSGRQGRVPPASSAQLEWSGRSPLFKSVMLLPAGVTAGRI